MSGSNLNSLSKIKCPESPSSFKLGFQEAFQMINENLAKELKKLENYPFMGERIMTLKIYKNKIKEILKEMELSYEQ